MQNFTVICGLFSSNLDRIFREIIIIFNTSQISLIILTLLHIFDDISNQNKETFCYYLLGKFSLSEDILIFINQTKNLCYNNIEETSKMS